MRILRPLAIAAAIAAALAAASAAADDQERARQAVAAGRILPLPVIVERALARFGGTVLDVEYEEDDDDEDDDDEDGGKRGPARRNRYEVKLLTADGRILKLDYDAASGELVGQRGRERERHRERRGHSEGE